MPETWYQQPEANELRGVQLEGVLVDLGSTCNVIDRETCDIMRDIMLQYCWVRVRAHKYCSFTAVDAVQMADFKVELSFYSSCRSLKS